MKIVRIFFPFPLLPFALLVLASVSPANAWAQSETEVVALTLPDEPTPQASSSQTPQSEAEKRQREREQSEKDVKAAVHQRLLGVIPNYNTYNGENAAPLSAGQKYRLAFKSSVNPFQFVVAGLSAGFAQATDDFDGYGQGTEGYAKRYGAAYADSFDGTIIGNAVFPALLHQDPRYFRLGKGSAMKRVLYSIETTVRCKSDSGKWQANYSNVLGNLVAGGISNLYYPSADRGFGLTVERALVVTAEGSLGSLFVEFMPDIQNRWRRHKARSTAQESTTQP
ncbi:MAG TPA: hypothetical protein VM554_15040 [Acidisarcina sp.]|nr:hypothetical protein [Acidisarcina sp.]